MTHASCHCATRQAVRYYILTAQVLVETWILIAGPPINATAKLSSPNAEQVPTAFAINSLGNNTHRYDDHAEDDDLIYALCNSKVSFHPLST